MGSKSSKPESKADIANAIKHSGLIPIHNSTTSIQSTPFSNTPFSQTAQIAPYDNQNYNPNNPPNPIPQPNANNRADSGLNIGTVLGGKWQLVDRVGRGAFGDIFLAEFVGESSSLPKELFRCALKVEKLEIADEETVKVALAHEAAVKEAQLKHEAAKRGEVYVPQPVTSQPVANAVYMKRCIVKLEAVILSKMQSSEFVSRFIEYGRDTHLQVAYLAMELLGENLLKLRRERKKCRFSLSTSLRFGILSLRALQHMHDAGFVHRDVKPSNFVIGTGDRTNQIYLIDFGLSRCYLDRLTGDVLDARADIGGFRGTPRYASINVHRELDLSRRDDLWSWFYILLEFLTGDLPWGAKRDKASIGLLKEKYHDAARLTKGCPSCFVVIFNHLDGLEFKERPNYNLLITLLEGKLNKLKIKFDEPFDWEDPFIKQANTLINDQLQNQSANQEVQARWSLNDQAINATAKQSNNQSNSHVNEEHKEEAPVIARGPSMTIIVHTDETNQPINQSTNQSTNQSFNQTRGSTISSTTTRARSGSTQTDEHEDLVLTPQPEMKRAFSSPGSNQSLSQNQYNQSPTGMSPSANQMNLSCSSPNPLWSRNPMSTRYDGAEAASPMFSMQPLAAPPSTPQPVSPMYQLSGNQTVNQLNNQLNQQLNLNQNQPQAPASPAIKPTYQVAPRETIKQSISQSNTQSLAHDNKAAPQLALNKNALSMRRKLQSINQSTNQTIHESNQQE